MIAIGKKVRFYISGDVVRDIGIVYFSEILKEIDVKYEVTRNYLEFDYINPKIISDYILDKKIFEVFANGNLRNIKDKISEYDTLNCSNFEEYLNRCELNLKEKEKLQKSFESRRFPYIRNSGVYGGNTSTDNMYSNFKRLTDIVINTNISVKEESLEEFQENDIKCSICNINNTTSLGIDLKLRKDSKYLFLFRGPERSGFKNNGDSPINICFECEFLNLMTILFINLQRPVMFGYTSDLRELLFINYKIMLKRKLYSDKAFYKKLIHEKISTLKLYDFKIDTNKGIILKFNSIVNYKELIRDIEYFDIIDGFTFQRESAKMKSMAKTMASNNSITSLKDMLLSNIIVIKEEGSSKNIDEASSCYNLSLYLKTLRFESGRGEEEMWKYNNEIYSKAGRTLSNKMDDNKKKNLVFKIVQLLKANDKQSIFQTIMHTLASYGVGIEKGFVEGLFTKDELEFNTNIGLFIQELMQYGGKKDE